MQKKSLKLLVNQKEAHKASGTSILARNSKKFFQKKRQKME